MDEDRALEIEKDDNDDDEPQISLHDVQIPADNKVTTPEKPNRMNSKMMSPQPLSKNSNSQGASGKLINGAAKNPPEEQTK